MLLNVFLFFSAKQIKLVENLKIHHWWLWKVVFTVISTGWKLFSASTTDRENYLSQSPVVNFGVFYWLDLVWHCTNKVQCVLKNIFQPWLVQSLKFKKKCRLDTKIWYPQVQIHKYSAKAYFALPKLRRLKYTRSPETWGSPNTIFKRLVGIENHWIYWFWQCYNICQ